MKKTSLYQRHLDAGARMVDFAGWMMPVRYSGVLKEQGAVRQNAGIFDVSHMGEITVEGTGAQDFVNRLVTNDVSKLNVGRSLYTVMCREDGGILDDLLVYRMDEAVFMLVVNASNTVKDLRWITSHAPAGGVEIRDVTDDFAILALQGPKTMEIFRRIAQIPESLEYFSFYRTTVNGGELIVSRTGYTGEDGLEILLDSQKGEDIWDAIMEAGKDTGLLPTGLAARDLLRIESGYPLYGNELDEETDPISAGLKWVVKMDTADFIGKSVLKKLKPPKKRVGICVEGKKIPRQGHPIIINGEKVGEVTSGTYSPVLQRPIGMGYIALHKNVEEDKLRPGQKLSVEIRGKEVAAEICRMPFVPPHTARKREGKGDGNT